MYHLQVKDSTLTVKSSNGASFTDTRVSEPEMSLAIFGIYGVVHFNNSKYLIVISDARAVGSIGNRSVYEVTGTRILLLGETRNEASAVKELLHSFLRLPGLYFSEYKLHRRLGSKSTDFLFNHKPIQNYLQMFGSSRLPPVECIQGYFCKFEELVLISRRSPSRAGARFFSRGVDESGFPSNFVETEQIVLGRNSYVQVRGSIPLEWKQIVGYGYRPPFKILGSSSFLRAHKVLETMYNRDIIYLNLIHDTGYEGDLFKEFDRHLRLNNLTFYNYNFKNHISKLEFPFGFTTTGFTNGEREQSAIIRTNCIDCLDRTNKMQYFIGKALLNAQLVDAGIVDDASRNAYQNAFKKMFEDGGNILSVQYAGTCAMSSTAIGMGSGSLRGSLRDLYLGASRYLINRVCHGRMQDSYEIITGSKTQGKVSRPGTVASFLLKALALLALSVAIFLVRIPPEKSYKIPKVLLYAMLLYLVVALFPIDYPSY